MKTTHYDISADATDIVEDFGDDTIPSPADNSADFADNIASPADNSADFADDIASPAADNGELVEAGAARPNRREIPLPDLSVIDEDDITWVARLIDMVVACEGQPWRVALERIDGAQYLDQPVPHHHVTAVVGAMQRVLGGRGHKAQLARTCRELVLGHPALTGATRADRVAAAARALALSVDDVERLLWADLPRERPVELPFGRPSELEVAAFANVQLIQRAVRRAQTISIAIRGDAGPLIRGASTRGLLATVEVTRARGAAPAPHLDAATSVDHDVTVIDIVGPLTLCHRTAVYGRAIASLVPLLAECSAFEMTLAATGVRGPYRSRLASPVLLPSLSAKTPTSSPTATRLARDLRRAIPSLEVVVGPPPILVGDTLLCPELAIDRDRLFVEIIGFWTASYLERKRAAYARAGLDVVLCVDQERSCADDALPENVIAFARHVDVASITRRLPMSESDGAVRALHTRTR